MAELKPLSVGFSVFLLNLNYVTVLFIFSSVTGDKPSGSMFLHWAEWAVFETLTFTPSTHKKLSKQINQQRGWLFLNNMGLHSAHTTFPPLQTYYTSHGLK